MIQKTFRGIRSIAMTNALSVRPGSLFLMFLAVRSGKSFKKRPLRISSPARCLGLRVLLGDYSYLPPFACHASCTRSYRSITIRRPLLFRLLSNPSALVFYMYLRFQFYTTSLIVLQSLYCCISSENTRKLIFDFKRC